MVGGKSLVINVVIEYKTILGANPKARFCHKHHSYIKLHFKNLTSLLAQKLFLFLN